MRIRTGSPQRLWAGPWRSTGILFVAAIVLSSIVGVASPASAANGDPTPWNVKPVPGSTAGALSKPAKPKSSVSMPIPKILDWKPGTFVGKLPEAPSSRMAANAVVTGSWTDVGDSGIQVAAAEASTAASTRRADTPKVTSVDAEVLSADEAKKVGLKGLVVALTNGDDSNASAPVAVRIPNSLLGAHYGANYAARLRWSVVTPAGSPLPPNLRSPSGQAQKLKHAVTSDVDTEQDKASDSTVAMPRIGSSKVLLTAAGSPTASDGSGNFTATPLKSASTWQVSAQTGDFSWSYALRAPPAAAGPSPDLSLDYDSQSVDGESGSTNNQPSAVGEGWSESGGGYIERTYVPCSLDDGASGPVVSSGDQCWKTDNATISFAGHSGRLIKDAASGTWQLQSDDGSRIEHLVGTSAGCAANGTYDDDCWRVTTTDGTQYFFGLDKLPGWSAGEPTTGSVWTEPVYGNDAGEPCHASSFAASSCMQAWRWNLDYVVDTHGNAEALYYDAEANKYSQNGGAAVSYVRGGQLDHIDYGFTDGNAYANNAASDRVVYGYAANGRCSDSSLATCTSEPINAAATAPSQPSAYPDVPFDQLCATTCPTSLSPTFWTDGMLESVTTFVLKSGSYSKVDSWKLDHSFPDPGDGTSPALWLTQITHTGYSGSSSIGEPPTVFAGVTMQNRVWVVDGLAPLDKYRIASITDSLGGITSVNYSPQECTPAMAPSIEASPQTNTHRCFPQQWTPSITPPQPPKNDLFHKYVVTSTVADPHTGGGADQATETDYVYGTPAWRYDTSPLLPAANRTWNEFAGYDAVEVRTGDHTHPDQQAVTDYTFFQGMDGDRASSAGGTRSVFVSGSSTTKDSLWFAGQVREQKTLMGVGGTVATDTVNDLWASTVKATDGVDSARFTGVATATATAPLSSGGNRTSTTLTTYDDDTGLAKTVEKDVSPDDVGPRCTTTSYAPKNTGAWIVGLVSEVSTVAVACADVPSATYPADGISDTRTSYDGQTWSAAPTKGDVSEVDVVDKYTGSSAASAHWVAQSRSQFDSMGRATQTTDVLGHVSSVVYSPAAGAPAGSGALTGKTTTETAPFGWHTTTTYDPAWGVETSYADENGDSTVANYDALGRRTAVWFPDNPKTTSSTLPSVAFGYTLSTNSPNAVETKTLVPNTVVESYVLYDGLGRPVQTQAPAEGGGSVITDTSYDGQGRSWATTGKYWVTGVTPSAALFVPADESDISSKTVNTFDPLGRTIKQALFSFGSERHETDTSFPGVDRTDVTPPVGGTPTSTFTDSENKTVKLIQYLAASPAASAPQESTTYQYDASGNMTGMSDPAGNHWSWGFDVLGHQVRVDDPDSGTTTRTFDDAGNLLTSTDARGIELAYAYDNLGRKVAEYKDATGSSGTLLASWSYDSVKKHQPASNSRYVGSTPGSPGIEYKSAINSYDAADHPTSTTISVPSGAPAFGGTSYTTTQAYYASGELASTTYPAEGGLASERVRTTYDGLGNMSGLVGTNTYDAATYTAIGQISQHERIGTDILFSGYSYDLASGQLTGIQQVSKVGSVFTHPSTVVYTNDEAGNVREEQSTSDSATTDTQCFDYDALQELTRAWTPSAGDCNAAPAAANLGGPAPYWIDYSIDPATGNRTSETSTSATGVTTSTYSYAPSSDPHPHGVQSVTTTAGTAAPTAASYGYNADGDTTSRAGETLTYDEDGNLSTVTGGSHTQSNVYDADGNLLLASDAGDYTLYMGGTELHEDAGSSGVSAVRTYALGTTPIAERSTSVGVSGSVLRWLATDNHDTATLEFLASTGAATVRYEDPYGNARGATAAWSSGHSYLNADESSTSHTVTLGARTYDPTIGKFLTVDGVLSPTNPLQNNGYAYSANSPVNNADPSGNCYNVPKLGCVGYAYVGKEVVQAVPTAAGNGKSKAPKEHLKSVKTSQCDAYTCNPNLDSGYDYRTVELIGSASRYGSAEHAMKEFQKDPTKIFPFKVEGCSAFVSGEECHLIDPIGLGPAGLALNGSGYVDVTTTSTTTLFTVSRTGYFDNVGSTIKFSTVVRGGNLYLIQDAHADDTIPLVRLGVMAGGAKATWQKQGDNLRKALSGK